LEIAFKPFDFEEYKTTLKKMTDEGMVAAGKKLRPLVYPPVVSARPTAFDLQHAALSPGRETWSMPSFVARADPAPLDMETIISRRILAV
jgi:hypothetical protein